MIYFASILLSFCGVFLKGFQLRNVMGRHLKTLAVTSYLIAAFEVATISIVIHGGWWVALTAGTGGAAGMLLSQVFHERIFPKKEKA